MDKVTIQYNDETFVFSGAVIKEVRSLVSAVHENTGEVTMVPGSIEIVLVIKGEQ
jgi:hypothetical protein